MRQFIAGGGEDNESPRQAAEREMLEETGIWAEGRLIPLNSVTNIPKSCFHTDDTGHWGPEVETIPEYCFALDIGDSGLALSDEHTEARWVDYNEACGLLKWVSNRKAMGEAALKSIRLAAQTFNESLI